MFFSTCLKPNLVIFVRDYMDENKSAASSRASSPHNFASRVRPSNGITPVSIQSQSQPITTQAMHTVAAPTAAQTTVVTVNVTNTNPVTVSLASQDTQENTAKRHLTQQACVPTSVIVSSADSGGEPPLKKLKILPSTRPKLINSMLSKHSPLKPIAASGSSAFHARTLGNAQLLSNTISIFNSGSSHEHSYVPVHSGTASGSAIIPQPK